jgi:bifunctional ADP-heptose synthase (sugar kinase/adenylyltransferase)
MDLRSLLSLDEYDIMVKGSDYRDKPIIGSDLAPAVRPTKYSCN